MPVIYPINHYYLLFVNYRSIDIEIEVIQSIKITELRFGFAITSFVKNNELNVLCTSLLLQQIVLINKITYEIIFY